jgi:hypothetical protein
MYNSPRGDRSNKVEVFEVPADDDVVDWAHDRYMLRDVVNIARVDACRTWRRKTRGEIEENALTRWSRDRKRPVWQPAAGEEALCFVWAHSGRA